jgi:hypothetical protein
VSAMPDCCPSPPDRRPSPMALLRSGVPLSLLLDLAFGPDSEHVLVTEPPWPRRVPAPRRADG